MLPIVLYGSALGVSSCVLQRAFSGVTALVYACPHIFRLHVVMSFIWRVCIQPLSLLLKLKPMRVCHSLCSCPWESTMYDVALFLCINLERFPGNLNVPCQ